MTDNQNQKPFDIRTFNATIIVSLTPFAAKRLVAALGKVDLDGNTVMYTMKKRLKDQIAYAVANEEAMSDDGSNGPQDNGRSYGDRDLDFGDDDEDEDEGHRPATVRRAASG